MKAKDKREGLSKDGSGRVGIYAATKMRHSYTLECNYNMGKSTNAIYPAACSNANVSPQRPAATRSEKYTPETWENVGRACGVAMLDLFGTNPLSRIIKSPFRSMEGLKKHVSNLLMRDASYRSGLSAMRKNSKKKQLKPQRKTRPSRVMSDTNTRTMAPSTKGQHSVRRANSLQPVRPSNGSENRGMNVNELWKQRALPSKGSSGIPRLPWKHQMSSTGKVKRRRSTQQRKKESQGERRHAAAAYWGKVTRQTGFFPAVPSKY